MKKIKTYGVLHRLTAAVMSLCILLSMLGGSGLLAMPAYAADPRAVAPTEDIVAGSRVADPDTMDDYINRLLTEANGSRYAGRVWTDKTVFAFGDGNSYQSQHFDGDHTITMEMATDGYVGSVGFNSDFAHVFSALASSQMVNEYPPSPVDLVIVFDMSGSMGQDTRYGIDPGGNGYQAHMATGDDSEHPWPETGVLMSDRIKNSRIQQTLDAINLTIDKLMAQNPQNRVAVCGYGANAVVLMPLGHYKRTDVNGDGNINESDPYITVGGMETLYHPSDLVYRTPGDKLTRGNDPLAPVREPGWYWMNNRDTCYTVVVNAEYNTYTGILDADGDGSSATDKTLDTDSWTKIDNKTVSNNVLDSNGKNVKAFPGVAEQTEEGLKQAGETFGNESRTVYRAASKDPDGDYGHGKRALIEAMASTEGLEANDYVGYFTNTQGGIYLAYKQLADSTATTYTEELTNGTISTVARIPAAIIMSDGGANFSFNEMGDNTPTGKPYSVNDWNIRYGQRTADSVNSFDGDTTDGKTQWRAYFEDPDYPERRSTEYMTDDMWTNNMAEGVREYLYNGNKVQEGRYIDNKHRLGDAGSTDQMGDEWYNVYLPGNDTLAHDATAEDPGRTKGYWKGLEGIYNFGADYFQDGTLTTAPAWNHAGVLYSSDNDLGGTGGTIMEVLLTASYMNEVVKEHYDHGWSKNDAAPDSRIPLSTYTMNVDTVHVPQWGRWRLFPTLDPKEYALDDIGTGWGNDTPTTEKDKKLAETYGGTAWGDPGNTYVNIYGAFSKLKDSWDKWKGGTDTDFAILTGLTPRIQINHLGSGHTYKAGGGTDSVEVTDKEVIDNIAYNDGFYDVTSGKLEDTFDEILGLILGNVFVPVSGDNDAGVGDSITYQDPIGEYMEIKNASIEATPLHTQEVPGEPPLSAGQQTYDMAVLLFGEMHGLVRTGVYDWHWNDTWMDKHNGDEDPVSDGKIEKDVTPFPEGWYNGDAATAKWGGNGALPTGGKDYADATQARADGWVYRMNYKTAAQFIPILSGVTSPQTVPEQMRNTVYTMYRFACSAADRNMLRRNPIYGAVPDELLAKWEKYGSNYPEGNSDYADTPGVYRLSDIRVWVEEYGDYTDTEGAIAPNSGYEKSLYVNIPAAAIPTELATITMGRTGVLSYETNLGKDHPKDSQIVDDEGNPQTVDQEMYQNFCYQSTPFRLFYAVGLEDDLILRDGSGNQVGVDTSSISPEYIQAHTADNGNIWFISNFYSGTRYSGYATDDTSRTRGDPTVTFSPGADNRYYVFQKPLPLYAHAYRVSTDYVGAVDLKGLTWKDPRAEGLTNSKTDWEEYNGQQQQAGSWVGGQFMGVYKSQEAFHAALADAKLDEDGKRYITDSHGSVYEIVDGGIIFSEEDLLDHVTTEIDGSVAEGSHSFSSDDYYFILLEFYVPYPGITGKNNGGDEVPGTQAGHMVQYALARKGSEFGSGYASGNISNGDMLCWTDTNDNLNVEFAYVSKSDTGDRTRGEPTWEKLTYTAQTKLREYLESIGISNDKKVPNPDFDASKETDPDTNPETIGALDQQVAYWTKMQADPMVQAALKAACKGGDTPTREQFDEYFDFAVAAQPGGIRSGDMSSNLQYKGTEYKAETGYYDKNVTHTSNTYYLPTVSDNSGTGDNVIIDNYLGNNGRLEIANQTLHVTKMIVPPAGYTLTDEQKEEAFNYQVSIQGVTGTRSAVKTEYNEYAESWERKLDYIDVLTDNSDLVQTNDSTRALFVKVDGETSVGASILARQVVLNADDGLYYYANDDGALPVDEAGNADPTQKVSDDIIGVDGANLYYMYLPSNGTAGTDTQHVHRLYQAEDYTGSDKIEGDLGKNGITTFVRESDPTTPSIPGEENRNSLRPADEKHPAGTKTYWSLDAELIPKSEVDAAEASALLADPPGEPGGFAAMALEEAGGGTWTHDDTHPGKHETLTYHDFFVRKPIEKTSESKFTSPYKSRTQYQTVTLNFGQNANANDGTNKDPGTLLEEADLYDSNTFGTVPDTARLRQITAEFTLKHGEGLMFSGLSGSEYRFTEKLTEDQLAKGYTLQKIEHVQQLTTEEYTDRNSVNGDTGDGEEQVNYINTFQPGDISITKKLDAKDGTTITDEDKKSEFKFTLEITPSGVGVPADGTYGYIITDADGSEVKTGRLLPQTGPAGLDPAEGANDIRASDAKNTTWEFTLKGGETMKVLNLPTTSGFTYTVTEYPGEGYEVTDSDTESSNADKTVTGKVGPGSAEPVKVEFTNTKQTPKPAKAELKLTKTVEVKAGSYTLKEHAFAFSVMPFADNPEEDPIPHLDSWDPVAGALIVWNQAPEESDPPKATAVIIPPDTDFKQAGTYKYTVREIIPSDTEPGVSYDGTVYTVTVTVEEEYDETTGIYTGKLKATVTYTKEEEDLAGDPPLPFKNEYNPTEIKLYLQAHKTLKDSADEDLPIRDKDYTFTLEPVSADYSIPYSNILPAEPDPAAGDAPNDAPPAGPEQDGPSITEPTQTPVPEATPEATAAPEATPEPSAEPEPTATAEPSAEPEPTATAEPTPEASDAPAASDEPAPSDGPAADAADIAATAAPQAYAVRQKPDAPADPGAPAADAFAPAETAAPAESAAPSPAPAVLSSNAVMPIAELPPMPDQTTVQCGADGYAYFGPITYDKPGTYVYLIREDASDGRLGVTYDPSIWRVTVTVRADASGALKAEVKYELEGSAEPPTEPPTAAEFANTMEVGKLTVKKTVTGSAGDKEKLFHFTVTLTDDEGNPLEYVNGRYGQMTFTKGVAEFTLKHGLSLTADDLPVGAHYRVEEQEAGKDGYTTTAPNAAGTISKDGVIVEVEFVNDRTPPPPPPPPPGPEPTPTPEPEPTPTPTNTPPPGRRIPNTGDDSLLLLWTAALLGSLAGLLAVGCAGRKKNKRERR